MSASKNRWKPIDDEAKAIDRTSPYAEYGKRILGLTYDGGVYIYYWWNPNDKARFTSGFISDVGLYTFRLKA